MSRFGNSTFVLFRISSLISTEESRNDWDHEVVKRCEKKSDDSFRQPNTTTLQDRMKMKDNEQFGETVPYFLAIPATYFIPSDDNVSPKMFMPERA